MWKAQFYIFDLSISLPWCTNGTISRLRTPYWLWLQELHKGRKHHLLAIIYFSQSLLEGYLERAKVTEMDEEENTGEGRVKNFIYILISLVCKGTSCLWRDRSWSWSLQNKYHAYKNRQCKNPTAQPQCCALGADRRNHTEWVWEWAPMSMGQGRICNAVFAWGLLHLRQAIRTHRCENNVCGFSPSRNFFVHQVNDELPCQSELFLPVR